MVTAGITCGITVLSKWVLPTGDLLRSAIFVLQPAATKSRARNQSQVSHENIINNKLEPCIKHLEMKLVSRHLQRCPSLKAQSEVHRQEESNASNMCQGRAHAPSVLGANHAPNASNPQFFTDIGPMELDMLFCRISKSSRKYHLDSLGESNKLVQDQCDALPVVLRGSSVAIQRSADNLFSISLLMCNRASPPAPCHMDHGITVAPWCLD